MVLNSILIWNIEIEIIERNFLNRCRRRKWTLELRVLYGTVLYNSCIKVIVGGTKNPGRWKSGFAPALSPRFDTSHIYNYGTSEFSVWMRASTPLSSPELERFRWHPWVVCHRSQILPCWVDPFRQWRGHLSYRIVHVRTMLMVIALYYLAHQGICYCECRYYLGALRLPLGVGAATVLDWIGELCYM